jgi:phosphonate transport system substrate-binding protein
VEEDMTRNRQQHTRYIFRRLAQAFVVGAALTVGLTSGLAAAEKKCEDPKALRFSIIPTEETIQELTLYKPVIDLLAKNTGKKIEFYMPTSYASVIEAMLGNWVDVAVHGPNSYVIGNEKSKNIEVFATYAKLKGHYQEEAPGYRAVLISKKGSKFSDIKALKGSVVALADPASTSGNLMPRVEFAKEIGNAELESYFGKVVYSGSHDKSAIAVHEGKADVAFVATHRLDNVINRGMAKADEFQVLWKSRLIPQDPFTYRGTLCDDLKKKIRDTFLNLHSMEAGKKYLANVKSAKFVAMSSADYDIIRDLRAAKAKAAKKK